MLLSCRLRACLRHRGSGESVCGMRGGRGGTHVEDHVADDFVVGDEGGIFFLCGEEAVHEVFLVFVVCEVCHALHELLNCIASGDGKIVKLIEPCQMGVLAKQLVQRGYLSDLEHVSKLLGNPCRVDIQQRSTASRSRQSATYHRHLCPVP